MIEHWIQNEISLKRYRRFKGNKLAVFSLAIFFTFNIFSFTAEIWANSKPLIMSYHGKLYFPVFFSYHPKEFNIQNSLVVDYRNLNSDWSLWPLIQWDPLKKMRRWQPTPHRPLPTISLAPMTGGEMSLPDCSMAFAMA